jgi:hypothetical protein
MEAQYYDCDDVYYYHTKHKDNMNKYYIDDSS